MNNPRRIQRHLVRAAAAGALLAAAALPLAIATSAGAVTTPTVTSIPFTPHGATGNTIAEGATGTVAITGTNFIDDGGTVTISDDGTGSGVVFTGAVETSATTATANYDATVGVAGTNYSLELSDNGGAGVLTNAFNVTAAPTITAVPDSTAPNTIYEGTGANTVTLSGSGFETGATVTFASDGDGTNGGANPSGNISSVGTGLTSSVTSVSPDGTSIVLSVTPTNPANSAVATLGGYTITVANPDGGSVVSSADAFNVNNGIQEVSPSAVPGTITASSDSVTLTGSGFEQGASVTITGCSDITAPSVGAVTANSAVVNFTETGTTAQATCVVTITNPNAAHGGNGAAYPTVAGALAVGEASTVAPIVTAATAPTTPVAVASATTTTPVTLTGTGFSQYSQLEPSAGQPGIAFNATTSSTGTSITAPVAVTSGASEGGVSVFVENGANESAPLANAFTVAGPAVTSSSPAAIATSAGYGTTITLTGTGFTPTTTGTLENLNSSGGNVSTQSGIVSYVSATSLTVTLTAALGAPAGGFLGVN